MNPQRSQRPSTGGLPPQVLIESPRARATSVSYPATGVTTLVVPTQHPEVMRAAQELWLSPVGTLRTTVSSALGPWGGRRFFRDGAVLERVRSHVGPGGALVGKAAVARSETRMTAACLDRELAPMVFVKIVGRRSRRAIANEYAWLTRLSAVPEMRRRVPVPLRCWQIDGITALELRPLTSTRRAAVEWSDEHEWFIEQLQRCGDRHASVGERLPSRIERRLARLRSFISPALNRLLADAARDLQRTWHDQPPRVVAHGDFTPWNVMQAPDGIRVVDWESAAADCPPMYDYLHFQLFSRAVRRRMQRADLARLLQPSASARIRRWQGSPASASRQCLAYLLDVITAYLEADDGENEGSAVVQQYARMLSERAEWLR